MIIRYLREYLVEHGQLIVAGLGKFETQNTGATAQDQGSTVVPPGRHVTFQEMDLEDEAFAQYIAQREPHKSEVEIREEINDFVKGIKRKVNTTAQADIPGVGRFELGLYGSLNFHPTETTATDPYSFGLPKLTATPYIDEEEDAATSGAAAKPKNKTGNSKTPVLLLVVLIPLVLIGAFLVYLYFNPGFYSEVAHKQENKAQQEAQRKAAEEKRKAEEAAQKAEEEAEKPEPKPQPTDLVVNSPQNRFYLIIGSQPTLEKGKAQVRELVGKGFDGAKVIAAQGRFRIAVANFADRAKADQFKSQNSQQFQGIWVFTF